MPKPKSSKTKSDRTDMFSLLAGGLDDNPPSSEAPTPVAASEPKLSAPVDPPIPEPVASPVVEAPITPPASPPTPVSTDASKQVNESTGKRKRRAKTGKRSDDAYMQTGMFLPVELVQEVKGYLAFDGNRQTIGDLTEGLLQTWADKKKAELAKRLSE